MTILAVNNDGGGIFHFLPLEGHTHFERHFGTPHGLSFAEIGRAFGIPGRRTEDRTDLESTLATGGDEPRLLEVMTDRAHNVTVHQEILTAVREAIAND